MRITYELFEDRSYQYIFELYYDVIDGLEYVDWGGIPGINLNHRVTQYGRVNMTPVFISERSFSPNRVHFKQEVQEANLTYLHRLKWLINTNTIYTGDKLVVQDTHCNNFHKISNLSRQWHVLSILQLLGMRLPIVIDGKTFEMSDGSVLIKAFLIEYEFLSSKRKKNQRDGQLSDKREEQNQLVYPSQYWQRYKNN